jgi:hypothetical protein
MKIKQNNPPRSFTTGLRGQITMYDCAHIELSADQQVTFTSNSGLEYDVSRKNWGFYATPSLNGRLKSFNLRAALVKNSYGKFYIMLVENGKEDLFYQYLTEEANEIITWLDTDEVLINIENMLIQKC